MIELLTCPICNFQINKYEFVNINYELKEVCKTCLIPFRDIECYYILIYNKGRKIISISLNTFFKKIIKSEDSITDISIMEQKYNSEFIKNIIINKYKLNTSLINLKIEIKLYIIKSQNKCSKCGCIIHNPNNFTYINNQIKIYCEKCYEKNVNE